GGKTHEAPSRFGNFGAPPGGRVQAHGTDVSRWTLPLDADRPLLLGRHVADYPLPKLSRGRPLPVDVHDVERAFLRRTLEHCSLEHSEHRRGERLVDSPKCAA